MTPSRSARGRRGGGRGLARTLGIGATGALALLAGGCGTDRPSRTGDGALDADVRVSPTPAVVGVSQVYVRASDGSAPLEGGRVRLRAEPLNAAEGGASVPPAFGAVPVDRWVDLPRAEEAAGAYGPLAVAFPWPGQWRLEVELTAGDGRSAVLSLPLSVVGTGGG